MLVWCEYTCNRKDVGYSQNYRDERTYSGITYYDCSSFVWYALKAGGFSIKDVSKGPFTTFYMPECLKKLGFKELPYSKNNIKTGDILWKRRNGYGHTEIVVDATYNITAGAHSSKLPLADQVSSRVDPITDWMKIYRWETEKKSDVQIAREVIKGKWGNGSERKKKLEAEGYDYNTIQSIVNTFLRGK